MCAAPAEYHASPSLLLNEIMWKPVSNNDTTRMHNGVLQVDGAEKHRGCFLFLLLVPGQGLTLISQAFLGCQRSVLGAHGFPA